MNLDSNSTQHVPQDEISLQEIFMVLWRRKILIIVITLIAGMLAGAFSAFAITPVYHSRLNIIINMPETYNTKYGSYELPISSNEQYINLILSNDILKDTIVDMGYDSGKVSVEALIARISIEPPDSKNDTKNSFNIDIASDDPEDARKLAITLYRNYIEFIDVLIAEGATAYFINQFTVLLDSLQDQLDSDRELLLKNQQLLENTPKTINQKEAINDAITSDDSNNFIVLENIINPNYTALELDIINIKQAINTKENTMNQYEVYLKELEATKAEISGYYETGDYAGLSDKIMSISRTSIYLPSEPVSPNRKSSPSNVRNALIGAVLGGLASAMIILIKEFWFTKTT